MTTAACDGSTLPAHARRLLWWGRSGVGYSRNRVLRQQFARLGWSVDDFRPRHSAFGDWEAWLRGIESPALVWVPCFRQRDVLAARRWSHARGLPLVVDPLISAWEKRVHERRRLPEDDPRARHLLAWETGLLRAADLLVADTQAHADFFAERFGVPRERICVVPVGAEEAVFHPGPSIPRQGGTVRDVLFFGSFIGLQGTSVIVEAARRYSGPPACWTLLGNGPEREGCEAAARGNRSIRFEDWIAYERLPERIRSADLILGIFGTSAKAARVIPNKVYQALACGRPVVTRHSRAYPEGCEGAASGLVFVEPGNAEALAAAVAALLEDPARLEVLTHGARAGFDRHFGEGRVRAALDEALARVVAPAS